MAVTGEMSGHLEASAYLLWWRGARAASRDRRRVVSRLRTPGLAASRTSTARPAFALPDRWPNAPADAAALTVDDGPDPRWTPQVLDILAENRVAATFFLIGRNVQRWPRLAGRVVAAGHAVGNHSWHHPEPFAARGDDALRAEVCAAQYRIEDATGVTPRLFRAPAGGWSPRVLRAVSAAGLTPVDWTIDTRDWARPGTSRVTRALRAACPGDILLCHDSGHDRSRTIAALIAALPELRRRGLRFVTL